MTKAVEWLLPQKWAGARPEGRERPPGRPPVAVGCSCSGIQPESQEDVRAVLKLQRQDSLQTLANAVMHMHQEMAF